MQAAMGLIPMAIQMFRKPKKTDEEKQAQALNEANRQEQMRVRREKAEASGLEAAATNQRNRPQFLSKAGYSGLRTRLGGARTA